MKLSIVILTKNEEDNIIDCLESVFFADEIIIIDDFSNDRTIEVVKGLDKKVEIFRYRLDNDFSKQRNFGLSKARNEWVLFLDADERISKELAFEISNSAIDAYNGIYLKRRDIIWGKELRYGETGNIKFLRLARKNSGKWEGKVHEEWQIRGKIGEFNHSLIHYPHDTVKEFLREINNYTDIRAKELYENKIKSNVYSIFLYPFVKFINNYIFKLGFLDGMPGFIHAMMMGFHSFLVRSKLWMLYLKK